MHLSISKYEVGLILASEVFPILEFSKPSLINFNQTQSIEAFEFIEKKYTQILNSIDPRD